MCSLDIRPVISQRPKPADSFPMSSFRQTKDCLFHARNFLSWQLPLYDLPICWWLGLLPKLTAFCGVSLNTFTELKWLPLKFWNILFCMKQELITFQWHPMGFEFKYFLIVRVQGRRGACLSILIGQAFYISICLSISFFFTFYLTFSYRPWIVSMQQQQQ